MAKSFRRLQKQMSPSRQAANQAAAKEMIAELALQELRKFLKLTQEEIAQALSIKQASVSKLEGQSDMQISTLSKYVSALGGRLKLIAAFPDGEVVIDGLTSPSSDKEKDAA